MLQSADLYLSATSGRMEKKEKGERQKSFSLSVPRPAFEITKSRTISLNSKTMKFKLN